MILNSLTRVKKTKWNNFFVFFVFAPTGGDLIAFKG
jgi:hypothetical protein